MKRKTVEEYLETIYVLEKKEEMAHTGRIASMMDVKPPSVTEMLQKLHSEGYVTYKPFVGARLTSKGRGRAKELMNRHRVLADFIELLGIGKELAEVDACEIEHHVSPRTMEALEKFIQFVQWKEDIPCWLDHFRYFYETGDYVECTPKNPESCPVHGNETRD